MEILNTIAPVFTVILIGWLLHRRGMIQPEFIAQANGVVYYIAIPAMIFRAISKEPFDAGSQIPVISITLAAMLIVVAIAWAGGISTYPERPARGTFIQTSFHGNLGYIGLAVAYYFLGDDGLTRASIVTGFMMILQNFLAVLILSVHCNAPEDQKGVRFVIRKMVMHPVILSAVVGLVWSSLGLEMPVVAGRTLDILKAMSLPLALLLIGASLSLDTIRYRAMSLALSQLFKLILLPAIGLALFSWWGISSHDCLPAMILLASPTATISYVMAKEMKGDAEFAVAAISASTLASAATFFFWLSVMGGA